MYTAISLPVIGEGVLTQVIGLRAAGLTFTALVAALSAAVLIRIARTHPGSARAGTTGGSVANARPTT
jgi:multisubunit Na+/H+ antiporter MnhB subunit